MTKFFRGRLKPNWQDDCEPNRNELAEKYITGQLDPTAQDDFETHILKCERCLRVVEALQTVRQDLAERAPKIRVSSAVQRFPFGWKWATIVSVFLVASGLGLLQLLSTRTENAKNARRATIQPYPSLTSTQAGSGGRTKTVEPTQPPPGNPLSRQQDGQRQLDTTAAQSQIKQSASSLPSSVPSEKMTAESLPPSLPSSSDASNQDVKAITGVAGTPEPAHSAESSSEASKEIFALGLVEAPPYTFEDFAAATGQPQKKGAKAASSKHADTPAAPRGIQLGGVDPKQIPGVRSDQTVSRSAKTGQDLFQKAMLAYVERRYADADALLQDAVKADPQASHANFFLGICKLMENRPADSVPPLKAVLVDEKSYFAQSAHFYLAKAFLQISNPTEAEAQFRAAAEMPGRLSAEAGSHLTRLQAVLAADAKRGKGEDLRKPD